MNNSSHTLFSLIRLALGTSSEAVDLSALTKADWEAVVDLAFDQGVAALMVDGLQKRLEVSGERLENDFLESEELEDLRYELFGEALSCEEDYRKYEEVISSLARTYSEAGIEMMVLKGYGLSLNYPVPEHRPVGDIDVYLNDNPSTSSGQALLPAWKRGDEIIRGRGIAIDYSHHHHSVFSWKGFTVENHYDIENRYASRKGREADDLLKGIVGRNRKGVGNVFLPSATFNGIFLTSHAASHFAGDRITLRHLLDWALFVDKEWREIDWPFVTDWLSRLGLLRFFDCMNALSIDCLGIAAEKFPSLDRDSELERRVLEDILHPTFDEKGSGFLFKLRRFKANMWKRNLVASEPLVPRLVRLAWSHVVKPEKELRSR